MILKLIKGCIRFYQRWISLRGPSCCRFIPTCSSYGLEALERHSYYGLWLMLKRLLRCHPWGSYGVDNVPVSRTKVGKNG